MLTIRLTRKGKKNQPFFRVIVIDKRRSSKGGRAVEELGYVNPLTKKKSLEKERILYWISKGAQPSPRVHNLLVSEKIIEAKKVRVFNAKKSKETFAAASAPSALTAPTQSAPKESPVPALQPVAENENEPLNTESPNKETLT